MPSQDAPLETTQILATCHALVQLEEELVGDPLEKATLKAIDWTLTKGLCAVSLAEGRGECVIYVYMNIWVRRDFRVRGYRHHKVA